MTTIPMKSSVLSRAILHALTQYPHFKEYDVSAQVTRLKAVLPLTKLADTVNVSVEDISKLLSFTVSVRIMEEGRI